MPADRHPRHPEARRPRRSGGGVGRVMAAVVAAGLLIAGCGARSGSSAARVDDLTADLVTQTDGALGETEARCVAEALDAAFGADAFQELVDAVAGDDSADVRSQVIDIFADCDALDPLLAAD